MAACDIDHQIADFVPVARPENFGTGRPGILLENIQPDVKITQHPVTDFLAGIAQGFECQPVIDKGGNPLGPLADEQGFGLLQGAL